MSGRWHKLADNSGRRRSEIGFGDKFSAMSAVPTPPPGAGAAPDPRFSFANERTFLAWNRTALALIGGGLAASQLVKSSVQHAGLIIGLPLIALGSVLGVAGFLRWRSNERALRLRKPLPRARLVPAMLGAGTAAIALLSLVLLVVSELRR
jgi:putative membrane protein